MMTDAFAARTLLSTLLGTPNSDGKARLNPSLDQSDLADSIQVAIDTLEDIANGYGTFFQPGDLPEGAFATADAGSDWLHANKKHIVDSMATAGNEAILTCLSMDGIEYDTE